MATHSSILAWKIPQTEAWRAIVHGVTKELDITEWLNNSKLVRWQLFCPTWNVFPF